MDTNVNGVLDSLDSAQSIMSKKEHRRPSRQPRKDHKAPNKRRANFAWFLTWFLVIAITAGIGTATRLSYTDYSANSDSLLSFQYRHITYSLYGIETIEEESGVELRNPALLIDDAEIIIECEFTGERSNSYLAFLSQVKVIDVLKGDESLKGTVIPVYEPVAIGKNKTQPATARAAYFHGGTPMAEGETYFLFLKKRVYAAEDNNKKDEYVICDNPFAKINIQEKQVLVDPDATITLHEACSYELLAEDEESAYDYFATKELLLEMLISNEASPVCVGK